MTRKKAKKRQFKVGDKVIWIEATKLLNKYIKPGRITGIKKIGEFTKYVVEFSYRFTPQRKWKKTRFLLPREQLASPNEAKLIVSSLELSFALKAANITLKTLGVLKMAQKAIDDKSYEKNKAMISTEGKKTKKEVLQFVKDAKQRQKEAENLAQLIIKATIK